MNANDLWSLATDLYPLPRSLTGAAVRQTLLRIRQELPDLQGESVPSGASAGDWTVPPEWNVDAATLEAPDGRVWDWADNALHLVSYSAPFAGTITRDQLRGRLYIGPPHLPDEAIPYVTSYYEQEPGWCMGRADAKTLPQGDYHIQINTSLDPAGRLDYAHLVVPGAVSDEVVFSTYTCHPNLANDNVSGMVVQTALAQWVASQPRRLSYRFVWAPETIGAVVYLHRHLWDVRANVRAGYVLNLLGDARAWSHVRTLAADTLADRVADAALRGLPGAADYAWLERRGSDERQYNMPGVGLPFARLSRTEHLDFSEYHTSEDDMSAITPEAMAESVEMLKDVVRLLEDDRTFALNTRGEPYLSKRGLYPTTGHGHRPRCLLNVAAMCDGNRRYLDICNALNAAPDAVAWALDTLLDHDIIQEA